VTATGPSQIDLAWTDNSDNEDGFQIERREGQVGDFAEVTTVMAGLTSYSDGSLLAATEYCYRVAAFNNEAYSGYSEVACATTESFPPPPPPDPVPTAGLRVRLVADELVGSATDGADLAAWPNLGSDSDAVQSSVSRRPTFHAPSFLFAGHAHVGFNEGTDNDELLEIAGITDHSSATLIVVFSQDHAGETNFGILGMYNSSSDRVALVTRHNQSGSDPIAYWDATHGYRDGTFVMSEDVPYIAVWRAEGGVAVDFQVNGETAGSQPLSGEVHRPFSSYLIGMTQPSTTSRFDGQVAEFLLYDRALSDCERDDVVATLGVRYGISVVVSGGGSCDPPAAPSGLTVTATGPSQIDLAWTDNSDNEDGFQIERREGQVGDFLEIASVSSGVTTYIDQSVGPATEYCYRVSAFNEQGSSFSTVACVTTPAVAPVNCTTDPRDNRSVLVEILTSSDPFLVSWRIEVGLLNTDPEQLVLVTDDAICQTLWSEASRSDPDESSLLAFFKLDDRYIVTNYINTDPSYGPIAIGYGITSVVDEQFNIINPSLAY
jgi:titin